MSILDHASAFRHSWHFQPKQLKKWEHSNNREVFSAFPVTCEGSLQSFSKALRLKLDSVMDAEQMRTVCSQEIYTACSFLALEGDLSTDEPTKERTIVVRTIKEYPDELRDRHVYWIGDTQYSCNLANQLLSQYPVLQSLYSDNISSIPMFFSAKKVEE